MAFTIGSGTFTNGSATVTGVTLTSGTLAYFASGTRMVVGVNPVIQEVEAIAAPTVSTITLRSAWTGTGGTYSFLANQTSEGLRDAVQAIRTNNASLQSFIDSIDTAATADSVAQRTSDGSLNVVGLGATGDITLAAGGKIKFNDDRYFSPENNVDGAEISANGVFKVKTGATPAERFRIDSSGNVGIGVSSPTLKTQITDGIAGPETDPEVFRPMLNLYSGGNTSAFGLTLGSRPTNGNTVQGGFIQSGSSITYRAGYDHIFRVNDVDRMRIDSSGNVAIGNTTPGVSASNLTGAGIYGVGQLNISIANNAAIDANRKTTEGDIAVFRYEGAQVGAIGVAGGDLYIGSSGTGVVFTDGINALIARSPLAPNTVQDNVHSLGWSNQRWAVVYAATGSINTSDAREKTPVDGFTADELNAAKQLSKEIGTYKFLSAVAKKGDDARKHIGMTVQRAIEIMEANNLDPFAYGFICYDAWEEKTVDHPAVEAKDAEHDEEGNLISEAVEAKDAYTEVVQEAGDRYSFRPDEMLFFIARGLEARIEALEG